MGGLGMKWIVLNDYVISILIVLKLISWGKWYQTCKAIFVLSLQDKIWINISIIIIKRIYKFLLIITNFKIYCNNLIISQLNIIFLVCYIRLKRNHSLLLQLYYV